MGRCRLIILIFWDVTPCRRTNGSRRFETLVMSTSLSIRPKFALIDAEDVIKILRNFYHTRKSESSAISLCHRNSTAEARIRSQASPHGICGGRGSILRVIRFYPVTITLPMLHKYLFFYLRRCVIFAIDNFVKQHFKRY